MKNLLLILFSLFILSPVHAQETESKIIAKSFSTGDVTTISTYFPGTLDMTVEKAEDVFSKAQATQILNQFFKTNQPSDFLVKHKGASKGGDFYQIGTLKTSNGDFRVTFFLKKDEERVFIKRLKIEENQGNF